METDSELIEYKQEINFYTTHQRITVGLFVFFFILIMSGVVFVVFKYNTKKTSLATSSDQIKFNLIGKNSNPNQQSVQGASTEQAGPQEQPPSVPPTPTTPPQTPTVAVSPTPTPTASPTPTNTPGPSATPTQTPTPTSTPTDTPTPSATTTPVPTVTGNMSPTPSPTPS